ncbi:uncharacterized protein LOC118411264 [Branchiostoma floridae]|uniref:Uncharacterized protein LOC118411264 n=1 Tax=Branchiostoma floridae TaxID=7739 RepID=A0A9J7KSC4_BRAFL|nr:uncharacterized protein LOC118411264 [Branchiostoma floridae]
MENQRSSSSQVTNKVECQGDHNKIINTGHNGKIVQVDHVYISVPYVIKELLDGMKKPLSPPTTPNKKPIRFRKLPGVINKMTSRERHNKIISMGPKGKTAQSDNVKVPVKYVIKKPYLHTARSNCIKKQIKHRKSLGHTVENKVTSQGNHNTIINTGNNATVVMVSSMTVEKPLSRAERLDTPKQRTCRWILDGLNQLSANAMFDECNEKIGRFFQHTKDPDYQAVLWVATANNCINAGDMERAGEALSNVMSLLDQTENSIEHELARDHFQSLIYLRENKYVEGERLTTRALCKTEHLQAGCMAAWILINHGWFYTKRTIQEQDPHKQPNLVSVATASFRRAIEYSDREFPGQLQDNKSRIRQFALIGQVYLLLRCWRSVDGSCTKPGNKITGKDVAKARKVLASLDPDKGEPLCAICMVLYHLANAHLCYRLNKYQDGLKEAKKARHLAAKGSFKQYHGFADSIVKHFERRVA